MILLVEDLFTEYQQQQRQKLLTVALNKQGYLVNILQQL